MRALRRVAATDFTVLIAGPSDPHRRSLISSKIGDSREAGERIFQCRSVVQPRIIASHRLHPHRQVEPLKLRLSSFGRLGEDLRAILELLSHPRWNNGQALMEGLRELGQLRVQAPQFSLTLRNGGCEGRGWTPCSMASMRR